MAAGGHTNNGALLILKDIVTGTVVKDIVIRDADNIGVTGMLSIEAIQINFDKSLYAYIKNDSDKIAFVYIPDVTAATLSIEVLTYDPVNPMTGLADFMFVDNNDNTEWTFLYSTSYSNINYTTFVRMSSSIVPPTVLD